MHLYQLASKELDQQFLNRDIVVCQAVIPINMLAALTSGSKLVVQLSNKAKYMGTVIKTQLSQQGDIAEGVLFIQRQ